MDEDERRRLRAHVRWLVASGAALERFGRLARDIPADQRNRIAHFAASVAAADGQVTPAEREFLETAYDGLAVSREQLQRDLRELLGEPEPVLASETDSPATSQFGVPAQRQPRYQADGIDPATLAQKRAETASVSSILQNLFAEDEVIETPVRRRAATSTRFPGLDVDDAELLERLLSEPAWPRETFDRLAGEVGILMPDGALEAINEWAFERYREAIIEDGEPLVVRRELVTGPA